MRITNQMMINSSMANIQVNKKQVNTLDTQLSTQKKINKPSEDPIIAIRALRLRASLNELTPFSYTPLRTHETVLDVVCRLLLENTITLWLGLTFLVYTSRQR